MLLLELQFLLFVNDLWVSECYWISFICSWYDCLMGYLFRFRLTHTCFSKCIENKYVNSYFPEARFSVYGVIEGFLLIRFILGSVWLNCSVLFSSQVQGSRVKHGGKQLHWPLCFEILAGDWVVYYDHSNEKCVCVGSIVEDEHLHFLLSVFLYAMLF